MKASPKFPAALSLAALLSCAAHGSTIEGAPHVAPVDPMNGVYFVCEQGKTTNGKQSADDVAYCRIVFERLERRRCETGLSQAIVGRREYSAEDCARLRTLLPKTTPR